MFQPSDALQRIVAASQRPATRPGPDMIALASGDPDFDTPTHIRQALYDAIEAGYTHYGDNRGDPELRDALAAEASTKTSTPVTRDEINVTHGGSAAISSTLIAILNPGDRLLLPEPIYSLYADAARLIGAEPVFVPTQPDFHLDLDAIRREAPSARMVVICHPNNPTGVIYSRDELEALAEIANEHDFYVMSDEAYDSIVFDDAEFVSTLEIDALRDRLIYLQTFSKRFAMTGWRLGYTITPVALAGPIGTIHRTMNGAGNTAIQRAAIAAITGPQDEVEHMRLEYQSRRELIAELLEGNPGTEFNLPDGTFYCFIKATGENAPRDLVSAALEHNIAIRAGSEFGPGGEGYFRITFATGRQNLHEGLLRLRSMLASWV